MKNKNINNLKTQDFIGTWVVKSVLGEYKKQLRVFSNLDYKYYPDTTKEEETFTGKASYNFKDDGKNEGELILENYGELIISSLDDDRNSFWAYDKKKSHHYIKVSQSIFI